MTSPEASRNKEQRFERKESTERSGWDQLRDAAQLLKDKFVRNKEVETSIERSLASLPPAKREQARKRYAALQETWEAQRARARAIALSAGMAITGLLAGGAEKNVEVPDQVAKVAALDKTPAPARDASEPTFTLTTEQTKQTRQAVETLATVVELARTTPVEEEPEMTPEEESAAAETEASLKLLARATELVEATAERTRWYGGYDGARKQIDLVVEAHVKDFGVTDAQAREDLATYLTRLCTPPTPDNEALVPPPHIMTEREQELMPLRRVASEMLMNALERKVDASDNQALLAQAEINPQDNTHP